MPFYVLKGRHYQGTHFSLQPTPPPPSIGRRCPTIAGIRYGGITLFFIAILIKIRIWNLSPRDFGGVTMARDGIYNKTCPACSTLVKLDKLRCACGYSFDSNAQEDQQLPEDRTVQDEE